MLFINPVELLNLSLDEGPDWSLDRIKRAKRVLYADIELSESESCDYHGRELSRSQCEQAIALLENRTTSEYLHHLAESNALGQFLSTGDPQSLKRFRVESIHSLQDFRDFIQSFLINALNPALRHAFEAGDIAQLEGVNQALALLPQSLIPAASSNLLGLLDSRLLELKSKREEILEEEIDEHDFKRIAEWAKRLFPVNIMNQLPSYFDTKRDKAAAELNKLQLAVWNVSYDGKLCLSLLDHLLWFNLSSVSEKTYRKNYELIDKAMREEEERKKYAPQLKAWTAVIAQLKTASEEINSGNKCTDIAVTRLLRVIDVAQLNALPSFATDVKVQIALIIRSIAISCWNEHKDIRSALKLTSFALTIDLPTEIVRRLVEDEAALQKIERDAEGYLICHFCNDNIPSEGLAIEKTLYKVTERSFLGRQVFFKKVKVKIPRCKTCFDAHGKVSSKFMAVFGAKSSAVQEAGIKPASTGELKRHPILAPLIRDGWSFSEPTA